jgi:hypothetical protein
MTVHGSVGAMIGLSGQPHGRTLGFPNRTRFVNHLVLHSGRSFWAGFV